MGKVFVIPDVHLKPWIFDRAEEELKKSDYDYIVFLGDLIDDWGQEENINLYRETFDRLKGFISEHPNFLYCYGNHELSYLWSKYETGYSSAARDTVLAGMSDIRSMLSRGSMAYIHRIDDVLFSHTGLTDRFISEHFPDHTGSFDEMLKNINEFGQSEMWKDISPIWVRPQDGYLEMYPKGFLQVVGHTPVEKADYFTGLLSVDTFSTYKTG